MLDSQLPEDVLALKRSTNRKIINCINTPNKKIINVEAIMGYGKTLTPSQIAFELLSKDDRYVFITITPSTNNLNGQTYEQIVKYITQENYLNIHPYLIGENESNDIPHNYNMYILGYDLCKTNGRLKKSIISLIDYLTKQGKRIIIIDDEAHIHKNNLDEFFGDNYYKKINLSATFDKNVSIDVKASYEACVAVNLVKRIVFFNDGEVYTDDFTIPTGNQHRNYTEYVEEWCGKCYLPYEECTLIGNTDKGTNVTPAFLTQVDRNVKDSKGDDEVNEIINIINTFNDPNQNPDFVKKYKQLLYAYVEGDITKCRSNDDVAISYINNNKPDELDAYLKDNNCPIRVIIIKDKYKLGWNCPRLNGLFQIRNSLSRQANLQVAGRTIRNLFLLIMKRIPYEYKNILTSTLIGNVDFKTDIKIPVMVGLTDCEQFLDGEHPFQNEFHIKTCSVDNNRIKKICNLENFEKEHINRVPPNKSSKYLLHEFKNLDNIEPTLYNIIKNYVNNSNNPSLSLNTIFLYIDELKSNFYRYVSSDANYMKVNDGFVMPPIITSFYSFKDTKKQYYNLNDSECVWKFLYKKDMNQRHCYQIDSYSEMLCQNILHEAYDSKFFACIKSVNINGREYPLYFKNHIPNSLIRNEYLHNGSIHTTYPDYIAKTINDRIYLIEVKAINANDIRYQYENDIKIEEIKSLHLMCSQLIPEQVYVLLINDIKRGYPIIHIYDDGKETIFDDGNSGYNFKNYMKNN